MLRLKDRGLHGKMKRIGADDYVGSEENPQVIGTLFQLAAGDGGDDELIAGCPCLLDQYLFGAVIGNLQQNLALDDVRLKLDGDGCGEIGISFFNILKRYLITAGLLNGLGFEPGRYRGIDPKTGFVAGRRFLDKTGTEQGDDHEADAEEIFSGHDYLPFPAVGAAVSIG